MREETKKSIFSIGCPVIIILLLVFAAPIFMDLDFSRKLTDEELLANPSPYNEPYNGDTSKPWLPGEAVPYTGPAYCYTGIDGFRAYADFFYRYDFDFCSYYRHDGYSIICCANEKLYPELLGIEQANQNYYERFLSDTDGIDEAGVPYTTSPHIRVKFKPVKYSYAQLDAYRILLNRKKDGICFPIFDRITAITVSSPSNRIIVYANNITDNLRKAIESVIPADAFYLKKETLESLAK